MHGIPCMRGGRGQRGCVRAAGDRTACTTGTVPYAIAYSWFSPHGSKRLGMSSRSQPAVMRCAMATLKPTQPRH